MLQAKIITTAGIFGAIADDAKNLVGRADLLSPADYKRLPPAIVEQVGEGLYTVVDGFHRLAGLLLWAKVEGVHLDEIDVPVVLASDPERPGDSDLIAAAAEPGEGQEDAIRAIYEEAGVDVG